MSVVCTEGRVAEGQRLPPSREDIQRFEARLAQMPQTEIPVTHTFAPGMYIRTLRIPAGSIMVGATHAGEHIFTMSKGEMLVATEDGYVHIKAPYQAVCRAGLKRVAFALTDVVGSNVHLTFETDLAKLEAELIVPGPKLQGSARAPLLEGVESCG